LSSAHRVTRKLPKREQGILEIKSKTTAMPSAV
jgi:hypothetical protein